MALTTRKPTGAVPWPLILIEGEEKAGKSYSLAVLSGSDKVGTTYWVDLGEGSQDEYGAVPGADYEVVVHDGTFASILDAVQEIHTIAGKAAKSGKKPVVLGIDSMSNEWEWLKDWATDRAKGSESNKRKLARDPNAEIKVSTNYWNDANARHRKLMKLLMTFPGIVVMTGRGKWVSVMGKNGQPIEGEKEYKVDGQRGLAFDATCWVSVSRTGPAVVVGARSVHAGIIPGQDKPKELPKKWTLEWLIFEFLKCDPSKAHVRDLVDAKKERHPEEIAKDALNPATSFARLGELHREAQALGYESVIVANGDNQEELLLSMIVRLGNARRPATDEQHNELRSLVLRADCFDDDDSRLRYFSETVNRPIAHERELTAPEAGQVMARLRGYIAQNTPPADAPQVEKAGVAA